MRTALIGSESAGHCVAQHITAFAVKLVSDEAQGRLGSSEN